MPWKVQDSPSCRRLSSPPPPPSTHPDLPPPHFSSHPAHPPPHQSSPLPPSTSSPRLLCCLPPHLPGLKKFGFQSPSGKPFFRFTPFFIRDILLPRPFNDDAPLNLSTNSRGEKAHVKIMSFLCMISDFNFISPFHLENSLHFSHVLRIGDS